MSTITQRAPEGRHLASAGPDVQDGLEVLGRIPS
jgi:hypothetical protein